MKSFSTLQAKLLQILSDNACHSGQQLADQLNVSRTAIWKQITILCDFGLEIARIPKQGYQLITPFVPLSEAQIVTYTKALDKNMARALTPHVFAEIPSTNQFLKNLCFDKSHVYLCTTEKQTKGRGRFNRYWHSPFGENIYCSLGMHFPGDPSALSGFSLIVSLAMHEVLQKYVTHPIQIKWPNDLVCENKKLAGILIELSGEGNSGTDLIIGMGININSTGQKIADINKPWCSLKDLTQKTFDRNLIIAELATTVYRYQLMFEAHGFKAFQNAWNQLDYLKDKALSINQTNNVITGYGRGVDIMGYLMIENEKGVIHTLSSGDTSLQEAYQYSE